MESWDLETGGVARTKAGEASPRDGSPPPLPVRTLDYYPSPTTTWGPIVWVLGIFAVLWGGSSLVVRLSPFLLGIGTFSPGGELRYFSFASLIVGLLQCAVAGLLAAAGILCMVRSPRRIGRTLLVAASIAMLVLGPCEAILSAYRMLSYTYSAGFAVPSGFAAYNVVSALARAGLSASPWVMVLYVLTRPDAKAVFER